MYSEVETEKHFFHYTKPQGIVVGFHGCEKEIADAVIAGEKHLLKSKNDYDWLGEGIYFWESDPKRAFHWASVIKKYKKPAVVGAYIDLGVCLNLVEQRAINELIAAYKILKFVMDSHNKKMPVNISGDSGRDLMWRNLDCAVINTVHELRRITNKVEYNTVRGVFWEGGPAFEGTSLTKRTHTQIAVRHTANILGYFHPLCFDPKLVNSK